MKKHKKSVALIMAMCLLFSLTSNSLAYEAKGVKGDIVSEEGYFAEIVEEMMALYANDSETVREALGKGVIVEEVIYEKAYATYLARLGLDLEGYIPRASTRAVGNNGNNIYANIPLIQQTTSFNCGPTSVLQALYGMNAQNSVSGANNAAKINTLMSNANATTGGAYVYKLRDTLNLYAPYSSYSYVGASSLNISSFQTRVENSLYYDMAPILHAETDALSYYRGNTYYHYIVISEVDRINSLIELQDCNHRTEYYGTHYVPLQEAFNAIKNSSEERYLICKTQ